MFGVRIGIRANLPELLDPLMSYLPAGWRPIRSSEVERLYSVIGADGAGLQESVRRVNFLFGNAQQLARTTQWEQLCEAFESDACFYVGQTTPTWLFVHAGVVGWKGCAVVIPGRSHSGKTTLVQALLEAGAAYYSDEFAVFDQEGRVRAFPRWLSVRTNATSARIAPAQFGARTGSESLPVGLVILSRYKPGARWRPKVLSLGEGMLGLLQNTLSARRYPELAFQTLERVVCRAHVLGGARGEAKETAQSILRHLEQVTA
ncbi:MAG: hypothetical protein LAO23_21515 [Acidobacteriia bacterium]|nr:hypothetical protein [Terriglobia bacterium]